MHKKYFVVIRTARETQCTKFFTFSVVIETQNSRILEHILNSALTTTQSTIHSVAPVSFEHFLYVMYVGYDPKKSFFYRSNCVLMKTRPTLIMQWKIHSYILVATVLITVGMASRV